MIGGSPALAIYRILIRLRGPGQDIAALPARPPGPIVWFHCQSEQAATALSAVLEQLAEICPEVQPLVTVPAGASTTLAPPTSIALQPPANDARHLRRFLRHWQPTAVFLIDGLTWPMPTLEITAHGTPLYAIGAAPPETGWLGRRVFRRTRRRLFTKFTRILTRDRESYRSLLRDGVNDSLLESLGPLAPPPPILPCNDAERDSLASLLSARPVWCATCPSADEIDDIVAAHTAAQGRSHRLLLVLAIDQDVDGEAVSARLEAADWSVGLRSRGDDPEPGIQIYIADLPGELGLWYRLSPIAFLGRTLHSTDPAPNPMSAAALGSAILHGPLTQGYTANYARLASAGAARLVASAGELGAAVDELLSPDQAAAMAHAAWEISSSGNAVAARILDLVQQSLPKEQD